MNTASQNINIADYYFEFLKNLKHDSKLDLISRLSESLKSTERIENTSLQSLFGAYKSKEEMIEIATIPSREVLLSKIAYLLKSPIQRLAIAVDQVSKTK